LPVLDHIEFILGEAMTAFRRNGWMTISAINTAAIALFIMGGLGYLYLALTAKMDTLPPMFELKFSVKSGTNPGQLAKMAGDLRAVDGVSKVVLLPKETEWPKWRKAKGMEADTADIENPLPDQFLVILADLRKADSVRSAIERQPRYEPLDGIRDAVEERQRVSAMIEFVRWAGLILGAITLFTAATLILNSVHLTVLARRQEIRIMGLVGATMGTVRSPFLLEGAMQGLLGGVLAGGLLWALAAYLSARSSELLGPLMSGDQSFPALRITLFLAAIGAVLGTLAAAISVRKYVRLAR
jgi:cell division transport system permease protein